jgi:hypothetical protein
MKIDRTILCDLPMVYAVTAVHMVDGVHFLAATELYGRCIHFSPPHYKASVATERPGGVMSIVPIPGGRGSVVAIERAYPIYHGDDSRISVLKPPTKATGLWSRREIAAVPFLHRLAMYRGPQSELTLVAATMVGGKANQDDWSQPGQILTGSIPRGRESLHLTPILKGLSRNHGLYLPGTSPEPTVLASGIEGLFALSRTPKGWLSRRLLNHDVSDVALFDIDGDGIDEVITIEPFHGDRFVIYRRSASGLRKELELPGAFGHVVWAGLLRGRRSLLLGDRAGRKELRLLTFRGDRTLKFESRVLDAGGGPANIAVVQTPGIDMILCANHARGDVSLFKLT